MSIIASTKSELPREVIPAANYLARCYSLVEEGTITEEYLGEEKTQKKVRIGWELPTETRVFKEENGMQPMVISKEYTLSMHEKSNLRKTVSSWRGKAITDEEAKAFDISKLIGQPCMLNIIHKEAKNGNIYPEISSVSSVPKGMTVPKQINPSFVLSYDDFNIEKFNSLPDFIKNKMKESAEYKAMSQPMDFSKLHELAKKNETKKVAVDESDLPF